MKTRPELTLADCEKIAAAAMAEARRNKWIVAIAILDDGGHLPAFRAHGRRDAGERRHRGGEGAHRGGVAAHRAAPGRSASRPAAEMLKMPGILPVQGGVPILVDGSCVGAVGVSGVQSHEDEQIAQAGIDALLKS